MPPSAVPSYIEELLSSKQAKRVCRDTSSFCYPCLRHFRFLADRDGFRVSRVGFCIRTAFVVFRRNDVSIRITAEDWGMYRFGYISIFKNNWSNEKIKQVSLPGVLQKFHDDVWPQFEVHHMRSEIRFWAKLMRANLDEIVSEVRKMRSSAIYPD